MGRGMIVLASEQLWPNLDGLVHWMDQQDGLSHLCIYHTSDPQRSAIPARRIQTFCQARFSSVDVELHESDIQPGSVSRQIEKWRSSLPVNEWIVNATGGVKLMFAGALPIIGQDNVRVVYRELSDKKWYELTRSEEGTIETVQLQIPALNMDTLPVDLIIRTHWEVPEESDLDCTTPDRYEMITLTETAASCNWDWREAFQKQGLPADEPSGMLFEKYIASALLEMGVSNLVLNVKSNKDNQAIQEVDLVANFGGSLKAIDCKLRSEDDPTSKKKDGEGICAQIRHASTTRRQLGGYGTELMLLRPNWILNEAEHALASTNQLAVIDAENAWGLFTELASWLNIESLPESLQECERILDQERQSGARTVFWRDVTQSVSVSPTKGWIDLDQLLKSQRSKLQDWSAYFSRGKVYLSCDIPDSIPKCEISKRIAETFRQIAIVESCKSSQSGKSCSVVLLPLQSGGWTQLKKLFEQLTGKLFLGGHEQEI